MSNVVPKFWRTENPVLWGLGLTSMILAFVFFIAGFTAHGGVSRAQEFVSLELNAIGDTLAGVFAPLAFIWIVVTVFLQSQELSEQRKELGLTREELRLAREAQEKQLEVMERQARIFENEQQQRVWDNSKKTLDGLIDAVAFKVNSCSERKTDFFILRHASQDDIMRLSSVSSRRSRPFSAPTGSTADDTLRAANETLKIFTDRLFGVNGDANISNLSKKSEDQALYRQIRSEIDEALRLKSRLAEDQLIRLRGLDLEGTAEALDLMLNADIWANVPGPTP